MIFTLGLGYSCCGCDRRVRKENAVYTYKNSCICKECYSKLERFDGARIILGDTYNDHTYTSFYYKGLFKKIFIAFKFSGCIANGHLLGMAAADILADKSELYDCDCITAVPLSKERMNERGYNQSEVLAEHYSELFGLEYMHLLKRVKHSQAQSASETVSRALNVKNAFTASDEVFGKKILLLDDVHTTGSTLAECKNTLLTAGALEVYLVTASYVYHKRRARLY